MNISVDGGVTVEGYCESRGELYRINPVFPVTPGLPEAFLSGNCAAPIDERIR